MAHLFVIIRVHYNLLSTQETRLSLVYLRTPHSCSVNSTVCCHLCLSMVVQGWFTKNGSGLETRVNLRQLMPVGRRFYCCMEDFGCLDPPCRCLYCPRQCVSPLLLSLAGDVAKSWGVGRVWSNFWNNERAGCFQVWISFQSQLCCRPQPKPLFSTQPEKVLRSSVLAWRVRWGWGSHFPEARFNHAWRLLQFVFFWCQLEL